MGTRHRVPSPLKTNAISKAGSPLARRRGISPDRGQRPPMGPRRGDGSGPGVLRRGLRCVAPSPRSPTQRFGSKSDAAPHRPRSRRYFGASRMRRSSPSGIQGRDVWEPVRAHHLQASRRGRQKLGALDGSGSHAAAAPHPPGPRHGATVGREGSPRLIDAGGMAPADKLMATVARTWPRSHGSHTICLRLKSAGSHQPWSQKPSVRPRPSIGCRQRSLQARSR